MPLPIEALRSNAEFIRSYFRAHPAASIHEAARAAVDARQGLHLEEISRIRRELLPELRPMAAALAQQVQPLAVKPHPPLPQKPRSPVQILREAVPLAPPVEAAPETPPKGEDMAPRKPVVPRMDVSPEDLKAGRQERGEGTLVRRRCLNAYLEKHPNVSAKSCKQALEDTFGHGLMLSYIQETVRLARATRNAPPVKPQAPAQQAAPPPAPVTPPSPAPALPAPAQAVQWGPLTVRDTLDMALREVAARLKTLAEAHGMSEASLVWAQGSVRVSYARTQRATLEV